MHFICVVSSNLYKNARRSCTFLCFVNDKSKAQRTRLEAYIDGGSRGLLPCLLLKPLAGTPSVSLPVIRKCQVLPSPSVPRQRQ